MENANNLLLTGANGFLGTEIVRQCESDSRSVRCVGRQVNPNAKDYFQIDLATDPLPDQMFAGIDTVIHSAGLAHQFGKSATDDQAFHRINSLAAERTIEAAAKNNVKHFVLISSSGVYGPDANCPDENSPCAPQGPYATSKLAGEQAAIAVAQRTNIRLTIARMTTLYGANDRGNLNRLIRAIHKKRFVQIGPCKNRKNLIHKHDAAAACVLLADASGSPIETYNVGVPPVTMHEVVDAIKVALKISRIPKIPTVLATLPTGAASVICAGKGPAARIHDAIKKWLRSDEFNTTKFREAFSFEPTMSLQAGIKEQVETYLASNNVAARPETIEK